MAENKNKRQIWVAIFTGILSLSSYILLFQNQEWVNYNFTRGGVYALFPIMVAFYFSFVYGTFTSSLLHLLGLRTSKGTKMKKQVQKREKL